MIHNKTLSKFLLGFAFVILALSSNNSLEAQQIKNPETKNFKIIIKKTIDGLKMQSIGGCAWVNLSFDNNNYQPRYINEFGLIDPANTAPDNDPNLAHFLFLIQKTERGIALKGMKGTAWTALSFSLPINAKQTIDRFGMVVAKQ